MKILVVVNPRAGSGKAKAKGRELCDLLRHEGIPFDVAETTAGGAASQRIHDAAANGVTVLLAVGGDGTFNQVSQSLITPEGEPARGPALSLLPAGTGSDLSRTLELPSDPRETLRRVRAGKVRRVDLGVLNCLDRSAQPTARAFLNISSVGFSAVIARRTNATPKWLGGTVTYLGASLLTALAYQNQPLAIRVDGRDWYEGKALFAAFANGRYFGGGMRVAPGADPGDGKLDCVLIGNLTKLQAYALTSHIYEGTHLSRHGVEVCQGIDFEVRPILADRRIEIEVDGETPGILPARIRVFPGAVSLVC